MARRTKEVFCSYKHRKRAQPHQPTSPARCYRASGNQSQHPTYCPPRVPRHHALKRQTVLRHPSQNRYRTRNSRQGLEGWEPTEGCCHARTGRRRTIREECWVSGTDVRMVLTQGSAWRGISHREMGDNLSGVPGGGTWHSFLVNGSATFMPHGDPVVWFSVVPNQMQ